MFASLQSKFAKQVLATYERSSEDLNTFYVVANYDTGKERLLCRSDAAIFVLVQVGGIRKLAALLMIVPVRWRDAIYNLIAKNRYHVFGRQDVCIMPEQKYEARFIDL